VLIAWGNLMRLAVAALVLCAACHGADAANVSFPYKCSWNNQYYASLTLATAACGSYDWSKLKSLSCTAQGVVGYKCQGNSNDPSGPTISWDTCFDAYSYSDATHSCQLVTVGECPEGSWVYDSATDVCVPSEWEGVNVEGVETILVALGLVVLAALGFIAARLR